MNSINNKIILGTVQFGLNYGINNKFGKPKIEEIFEILDYAYANNITLLDTADAYGNSSDVIGLYHQCHTNQFDVITKFKSKNNFLLKEWMDQQLERLNIKQLYACMFHDFEDYKNNQHLIIELKIKQEKGIINKIGVSVYTNSQFEEVINDSNIELIQLPYNLLDNYSQRGKLLEIAKEMGKEIHTRSVFLQGLFFKDIDEFQKKLAPLKVSVSKLIELSNKFKIGVGSIALNYTTNNKNIDNVLMGVDTLEQLKSNLEILNQALPKELVNKIDKIIVQDIELLNPSNWK